MSDNLFEAVEYFELVDVDRVVLNEPLTIREPSGFGEIKLTLTRNLDDRGGCNFEFGDSESTLGFDRFCGYNQILEVIKLSGTDSNLVLNYYREGVVNYSGSLVISSFTEEDDEIKFRIKRDDFGEKLRTRYDVDNSIEDAFDLDGNEISQVKLDEIALHSKALCLKYEVINNTSEDAFTYNYFFENPDFGGHGNGYFLSAWLQFGASEQNVNTIDEHLLAVDYGTRIVSSSSGTPAAIEDYPRANYLYNFKVLKTGEQDFSLFIKANLDLKLHPSIGGNTSRLTFYLSFWVVNPNGSIAYFEKLVPDKVFTSYGDIDETIDINVNRTIPLDLAEGQNIYIYGVIDFFNVSGSVVENKTVDYTIDLESLYYSITKKDFSKPSLCKGMFIYEALNRLIQKAICNYVVKLSYISGGSPAIGDKVNGLKSKAYGFVSYVYPTSEGGVRSIDLVDVNGSFIDGETVKSGIFVFPNIFDVHKLTTKKQSDTLSSSLLEDGGCASLNFVTNGFAIRNFLNEDFDEDVFYKKGDNVTHGVLDYTYINEDVTRGNYPNDDLFWVVQKGRKISTSIKKLVDFVKWRYGAGFAIVKINGAAKVLIEHQSYFFQDVEVIAIDGVENPITRTINKDILYNTIELGYTLFSKENEQSSISGFNTDREYLTPIKKDKGKLSLMCDVCTDGYEIERLRRLTQSETPNESDDKDEETFVIKLRLVNSSYLLDPKKYALNQADPDTYRVKITTIFTPELKVLYIEGLIIKGIEVGDIISIPAWLDYNISNIFYNFEQNRTELKFTQTTWAADFDNTFYFKDSLGASKNVYLPEINEATKNQINSNDIQSEYNIDHTPTNFLINNFAWFGGVFRTKKDFEKVIFTKGTNNVSFKKENRFLNCNKTTQSIAENQDFTLESLREWSPVFFDENEYQIDANFSYSDLEKIRKSMVGESIGTNYGYVTFVDNQGVTRKGYPIKVVYKALDNTASLTLWGKA